jgi:hypothetical protein
MSRCVHILPLTCLFTHKVNVAVESTEKTSIAGSAHLLMFGYKRKHAGLLMNTVGYLWKGLDPLKKYHVFCYPSLRKKDWCGEPGL